MRRQLSMCGAAYPGQAGSLAGGSGVLLDDLGLEGGGEQRTWPTTGL